MDIKFKQCEWDEISNRVESYFIDNNITVDSYWEDHVMNSNHYKIMCEEELIGFFAIFNKSLITLFNMTPNYAKYAQSIFARIKRYEQVTSAFVSTGDEFLLSHAVDDFVKLEKQAYFSIYTEKDTKDKKTLELEQIDGNTDESIFKLAHDYFDEDIEKIKKGLDYYRLYKIKHENKLIGFGVVEYGRVIKNMASVGMYVVEEHRQKGYGSNILKTLQTLVENEGYIARSGCWYYNHNSKKSMEAAGTYSKTRLLKFFF
ncbi:MAG: GNAT family N-acetyltransferase [Clostridiales bacterium]|nr:GNAT family N-acetyltransferase [Clostridiales bacterium]